MYMLHQYKHNISSFLILKFEILIDNYFPTLCQNCKHYTYQYLPCLQPPRILHFSVCSTEEGENSHDSSSVPPSIAEIDNEVEGSDNKQNNIDKHKQKAAHESGDDEIMV